MCLLCSSSFNKLNVAHSSGNRDAHFGAHCAICQEWNKIHADVTKVSILITSEHILCSVDRPHRFHEEFKLNSLERQTNKLSTQQSDISFSHHTMKWLIISNHYILDWPAAMWTDFKVHIQMLKGIQIDRFFKRKFYNFFCYVLHSECFIILYIHGNFIFKHFNLNLVQNAFFFL